MNRTIHIRALISAIALSSSLICSCARNTSSISKRPITLRLSEVHSRGYPTALADGEFARLVEEKTEGRVRIEVRTGGALAENEIDSIAALKLGDLAFSRVSAAPVAEYVPKINAIMLPYIYRSQEHMWNVLNGKIGQDILSEIEQSPTGLIGLCYYDGGARNFYMKGTVRSPKDLAGKRIRVQNGSMQSDMCKALGATPVTGIGMSHVRAAIEEGLIDGAENNLPTYQSSGDYLSAPCYLLDSHTRIPEILLASKKALTRVSPDDIAIIRKCAKETQQFEIQKWLEQERASEQIVRNNGNEIIKPSPEVQAEFQNAMTPLYQKYGSQYSDILTAIKNTN